MKKTNLSYINREMSWLAFNQRVLDQASLERHPLLERVKFLAITASNLDEFFMVRVGGLKLVQDSGGEQIDIAGWSVEKQLKKIRQRVREMYASQSACLAELDAALEAHSIRRVRAEDLTENDRQVLLNRFRDETMSAIAPTAFENTMQMSLLRGARLAICVRLKNEPGSSLHELNEESGNEAQAERSNFRYVLLALGQSQSRIWSLPSDSGYRYMLIEDVVQLFLSEFFDAESIVESSAVRITRNGDVELVEDARADLLVGMRAILEARQTSGCVRMELSHNCSPTMRRYLESAVDVDPEDVYLIEGPMALSDFFGLAGISGFRELKDKPWPPQPAPEFLGQDIFNTITAADRLLYHPYQEYDPVVQFIKAAAGDDDVIAIKQTLYRTSKNSEIIQALKQAAGAGKNVTAIVELKARFDEAQNIYWARQLEQAGVDVVYGVRGLKTHAKMCLVVRRERTGIKRYVHFATGNYNESTARLYSDVSLFTCDEQLGADAVHFFNAITGLSVPQSLGKLAAAPINLRETMLDLIRLETEAARRGATAEITAKVNSLSDKKIIDALYEASQAGVKIRLNIRGICCLVPGKKGLSENIKVISVVDRLLEHARIFRFRHGGDELHYIASADWMGRNLDRRVELMVPVLDPDCKSRLNRILNCYFDDNVAATELMHDGTFRPVARKKKKDAFRAQEHLQKEAVQIYAAQTNPGATVFEPVRGDVQGR